MIISKRFFLLKRGEQFLFEGWDLMKIGFVTARSAHSQLKNDLFFWPWDMVETIKPNPYCSKDCQCQKIN